jgi:transposase
VCLGRSRSRDTYLAAQFWRLSRRIGKKKAAVAVGHSILSLSGTCWPTTVTMPTLAATFFVRRDTDAPGNAVAQLQTLGYRVTLEPTAA